MKIKIYQLQIQWEIIIIPEMSYGVKFRKQANTDLYKLYNTNLHEKIEMQKAKELLEKSNWVINPVLI